MKDVVDIVAADTTGEWGMGKYTGRRSSPTHVGCRGGPKETPASSRGRGRHA
jgi:hypothetical protein